MKNFFKKVAVISALIIGGANSAYAQFTSGGTYSFYSPYSLYGIGDLYNQGTAYNKSMGGVGIATRNRRYLSYTNPASITCRDSLSFMSDFGVEALESVYTQSDIMSAGNTFNMHNFAMSFPIWRKSAFVMGFTPYSNMGYDFASIETDPDIIGTIGNMGTKAYGQGTLNEVFLGAATTLLKNLNVGVTGSMYFGSFSKYSYLVYGSSAYSSDYSGYNSYMTGFTAKFGAQYDIRLSQSTSMTLGATYKLPARLRGESTDYLYSVHTSASIVDTLSYKTHDYSKYKLFTGSEVGAGVALRVAERWNVEVNYIMGDWRNSGYDSFDPFMVTGTGVNYKSSLSHSVKAGLEYVPNRNDIRYYYKRIAYRGGAYWQQSPYTVNGLGVWSAGLTAGVTLPVFRYFNGVTLGLDAGTTRSQDPTLVHHNYVRFFVGFNIHDYWFHKNAYR